MRHAVFAIAGLGLFLVACETHKVACERYADMELRCAPADLENRGIAREQATYYCEQADHGGDDDWHSTWQRHELRCAEESTSCPDYARCKDAITIPD